MTIDVHQTPSPELMDYFEKRLYEFNIQTWDIKEKIPLALTVTDPATKEIIAGVSAKTFGNWLLIENLWVSEKLRGQDIGTKLLRTLELAAIERGCQFALLDTLDFQARPFYEKFGYAVAWTQTQYPKSGCKHFMIKTLQ